MTERDMREVVQRLRRQNSDALLELGEFEQALTELFKATEALTRLCAESGTTRREGAHELVGSARQSSYPMQSAAELLLSAFAELRKGVEGWAISTPPRAAGEPAPPETN